MNLAPSGTMSGVDSGARFITPRSPIPERRSLRSSNARSMRGCAGVAGSDGGGLSVSSTALAFASMMSGPARAMRPPVRDGASGARLAAKHALKERGGLNELARAREACRLPNDVLVQHRLHRVLSARAALTAGLACNAPSTETEAMVARASSGVTSWEMLARPRTLMCSISPARCTASRSSRL